MCPIAKERKRGVDSNLDITGSCATGWRGEGSGHRAPVIEGVPIADSDAGHSCEVKENVLNIKKGRTEVKKKETKTHRVQVVQ